MIVTGTAQDRFRLDVALRVGADHVIDVDAEDPVERVAEITGGGMADVVIDAASGNPVTVTLAMEMVRRGGHVVIAGMKDRRPVEGFISDWIPMRQITIHPGAGLDVERAVALLNAGDVPTGVLLGETFTLDRFEEAFAPMTRQVPGHATRSGSRSRLQSEERRCHTSPNPPKVLGPALPGARNRAVSYEDSISPEFYELERKAIFKRTWLNVGRVEQLPRTGATSPKRSRPPIRRWWSCAHRRRVRAFHNICRHRGNKLVGRTSRDEGRAACRQFVCKYHGWRYCSRRSARSCSRRTSSSISIRPITAWCPSSSTCGRGSSS